MKSEEERWQGHRDLNPRPADLESAVATVELARTTVRTTSVYAGDRVVGGGFPRFGGLSPDRAIA